MFEDARCATEFADPELWFASMGTETGGLGGQISLEARRAKRICSTCPARLDCLAVALRNERTQRYRWGIWGGLTPNERHELAKKRRVA